MNMMIKALGASSCLLLLASFFLSACSSTDEDFFYQDEPRVRLVGENIWAAGTDSVMFSFVAFGSDVVEKAIMVDAQIMGFRQRQPDCISRWLSRPTSSRV